MSKNAKSIVLILGFALAGCATPKETCVSNATKDHRTLKRIISETELNIARGYGIHRQQIPYTVNNTCYRNNAYTGAMEAYSCPSTRYRIQETPVAINISNERSKLAEFRRALPKYQAQAQAGVDQCNSQFPES